MYTAAQRNAWEAGSSLKDPQSTLEQAIASEQKMRAESPLPNTKLPGLSKDWVNGDPGPYGLLGFGMTTCMLMFIETSWAESDFLPTVFCYALFYGGAGQFVAGVLELIKGNTFGGTAFTSYGSFWMGWFLLQLLTKQHPTLYAAALTGKSLWCGLWAVLTAGLFVVTMRKNGCLMTIFSTLTLTFALLAGGVWSERCARAAGYTGFFCGGSAIYAAFAFLYEKELGIKLPGVRAVNFLPASAHLGAVVLPVH